jgi:membrane-associated PAP2 superfamily phosphatase
LQTPNSNSGTVSAGPAEGRSRFWVLHALLPVGLFLVTIIAVKLGGIDFKVANAWFNLSAGKFPARDAYLAKIVFHDGGNRLIFFMAMGSLAVSLLGLVKQRLRPCSRAAIYVALCIGLTAGLAAIGKQLTNMDCPWSVTRFGGDRPYVSLFSDRPETLPRGGCFPGAHSAGAFALFAFYFVWRRRNPRRARAALVCAAALGTLYAVTQWARGAHFVSHDVWAALLAWLVCLVGYVMFGKRLWPGENDRGENQSPAAMGGT